MNFEKCELFELRRKRDLYHILRTTPQKVVLILNKYKACINDDGRLLEKPTKELKSLQKRLLNKLYDIEFPAYVFSGIKGRSAFNNVLEHIDSPYMLKLDMSKFFPNTHRNNVYTFFLNKLKMSPDVAQICTDIVTINYEEKIVHVEKDVYPYMKEKHIKSKKHLPSGTPTSQILSYLANLNMFDEIINYCKKHNFKCSI